jgi:predicted transcriptional regulator
MKFTVTQLNILYQKGKGKNTISEIALALKKSKSQVYRALNDLSNMRIVKLNRGNFELNLNTHINLLVNNLLNHPNLINILSDSSIQILQECLSPITISEISNKTKLYKATIYNWIKKYQKVSIIKKSDNKYLFNTKLWNDLKEFLIEFKKFNDSIDFRINPSAKIYYKDKNLIVFATKTLENASPTAFSEYTKFGIDILTIKKYYSLPIKTNNVVDVFTHSLYIAEKEKDFRNLLFIALFYLKNKTKLNKINNPILDDIKLIIKGENIKGYPTLSDIKDRAKLYDVEV